MASWEVLRIGHHHCRQNALKDGTKDIEDISSQPDDDELER